MAFLSNNKWLLRLIILFMLINLLLLGYLVWVKPNNNYVQKAPKYSTEELTKILTNELSLTEQQVEQIKQIRQSFYEQEEILSEQMKAQRDSMNLFMFNEKIDTVLVKQIAMNVSKNEYQMELLRLAQAQQLNSIINPAQRMKLNQLVKEIRDYFKPIRKK